MYVPLDDVPKTFNPACGLVFALPASVFGLVDDPMDVEFLTVIIAAPEISEDFCAFMNIVPDHLGACDFGSVFHHERADVFCTALVET